MFVLAAIISLYTLFLLFYSLKVHAEADSSLGWIFLLSFLLLFGTKQITALYLCWIPLVTVTTFPWCRNLRWPVYLVCLMYPGLVVVTGWQDYREFQSLREEYTEQNLQTRLAYEAPHRDPYSHEYQPEHGDRTELSIDAEFKNAIQRADRRTIQSRTRSLRILHQTHNTTVVHFILEAGFGLERTLELPPRRKYIDLPEPEPIPFRAQPQPISFAELDDAWEVWASGTDDDSLIAETPFTKLHARSIINFANPVEFGYTPEPTINYGFQSHAFRDYPRISPVRSHHQTQWHITKVELVSLLKHESPRVYLSDHLPMMEELVDAPTRPLNLFESSAIERLQNGEEVVTRWGSNSIYMVGAIRCLQECRQCHQVRAGSLLGAFSYELRRVTPKPEPKTDQRISFHNFMQLEFSSLTEMRNRKRSHVFSLVNKIGIKG